MVTPKTLSVNDPRWENHVPWSLAHAVSIQANDYTRFCGLIGMRLKNFFEHKECGPLASQKYTFIRRLPVESLGKFEYDEGRSPESQIESFFSSELLSVRPLENAILRRLDVLQSFLILAAEANNGSLSPSFMRDIRRFAVACNVMLDVKGCPPALIPIEQPLLQKEVIDKLLPKLSDRFPQRATELLNAYKDMLRGVELNLVFSHAYKALEALAHDITQNNSLLLSDKAGMRKYFGNLHPTILATIDKLAAHRGDEGSHGSKAPDEYEIRYLLFSICNIALLFLEYTDNCGRK